MVLGNKISLKLIDSLEWPGNYKDLLTVRGHFDSVDE